MKLPARPYLWLWIEFIFIGLSIAVPIALMNIHLTGTPKIFSCLSTAFLISLPFIFLPSRWRPLSLIPVWLIAVFYLTNIWYLRFFKDFIPLQNYFLFSNFDSDLFRAGADMVKPVDIMLALPAICLTLAYIFGLFKCACSVRFSKITRSSILGVTLCCYLFSEYSNSIKDDSKFLNFSENIKQVLKKYDSPLGPWGATVPLTEYNVSGLLPYICSGINRQVAHYFYDRSITQDEIIILEDFHRLHKDISTVYADTIIDFSINRDKNLIVIVVESLNAWVVDYEINGRKVMPVLSELLRSDGAISSCEMVNQTHSGVSSDGQFIYNTGMYAASDVTTVLEYLDNDLPSLAKVFKPRKSFEIICESPNMWNHIKSNKAYGFDEFIYNTDLRARKEKTGRDGAMFKTALEVIDTISKPFFGMLITMSMHGPFIDENVSQPKWISDISGLSNQMKNYLTVSNYFDKCLGNFLDSLKKKGIYDNTVIAIASDHNVYVEGSGYDHNYTKIVFCLMNSGTTLHSSSPMGQVDVFPTLLQVMDKYDKNSYCGMGLSMFNPELKGAIDKNFRIHGDSLSVSFRKMLERSGQAANLILKSNSHYE